MSRTKGGRGGNDEKRWRTTRRVGKYGPRFPKRLWTRAYIRADVGTPFIYISWPFDFHRKCQSVLLTARKAYSECRAARDQSFKKRERGRTTRKAKWRPAGQGNCETMAVDGIATFETILPALARPETSISDFDGSTCKDELCRPYRRSKQETRSQRQRR